MICAHYESAECRSCAWIRLDYSEQLARKQADATARLAGFGTLDWLPAVASPQQAFRNKAKMAAFGTAETPGLGLAFPEAPPVDLCDCPLYPPGLLSAFGPIKDFIRAASITPYDLDARSGELKFVILTQAEHSGELMLRFVLRSQAAIARMRKHLPGLLEALPGLRVISANIQPVHQAVLEGESEIVLGLHEHMDIALNGVRLRLGTRSFLQTNSGVAAQLYARAAQWCAGIQPQRVMDLYCGIGGFAFHCAEHSEVVLGIEISEEAVRAANANAASQGMPNVRFLAGDAEAALASATVPELLIVNPPRRGIGAALAKRIEGSRIPWLIYSSCNVESLARDLAELPGFELVNAQLFDMFPNTAHYELLVLARRRTRLR